jgi:hypothetical protein
VLPPRHAPAGSSPPARRRSTAASIGPARVTVMQRSQPGDLALLEVLRLYEQAIQHAYAELVATACRDGEEHAARCVFLIFMAGQRLT